MEEIKQCPYYKTGRKCTNKKYCAEQAGDDDCMSYRYYAKDLELQLQLEKDNVEELKELLICEKEENKALNKITGILGCPTAATARRLKHTIKELNNRNINYKQAIDKIKEISKGCCDNCDYMGKNDTDCECTNSKLNTIFEIINEVEE